MIAKRAKAIQFASLIDTDVIPWLAIPIIAVSVVDTSAAFATGYHKGWT